MRFFSNVCISSHWRTGIAGLACAGVFSFGTPTLARQNPIVYPTPAEMKVDEGVFTIDASTSIVIPETADPDTNFAGNLLVRDLADRFGQTILFNRRPRIKGATNYILIGSLANPLVKEYCSSEGLLRPLAELGEEGYILSVAGNRVVVAGNTDKGVLWGLSSLRQIIRRDEAGVTIPRLFVKDAPVYSLRGIKLYLPGKENIQFFKRFIKDFVALYKFNTIILELNANMRLTRHPELNTATVAFERHLRDNRLDRPLGPHREYQNSSHQDNADGNILEKEEVADLVAYMRKFNIQVIPELPALTHSYYLLAAHKEFAENTLQPYPDTYCPLKPGIYALYFDVLDEYIDVIHPSVVHVGHDEWRMEKDLCSLCRGKDYGKLFADDLNKIHDYLMRKGIRTAIWGDHLLESVRAKGHRTWKTSTGYEYNIPAALTAEQVAALIPKDILIFNWFWDDVNNDKQLSDFGFQQVYGNLLPAIENWDERRNIKGVLGGAPSSWAATTEINFGKDQLYDFLGTANMLWSRQRLSEEELAFKIEPLIAGIYNDLRGNPLPSRRGSPVHTLDISSSFNASLAARLQPGGPVALKKGALVTGNQKFVLTSGEGAGVNCIVSAAAVDDTIAKSNSGFQINRDVNSIIFLHASAAPGFNNKAYDIIHNFNDTAEPLGWYEVVYEDGLVETIPIRYGINILDWRWRQRITNHEKGKGKYIQDRYAYQAKAVDCAAQGSQPVTFFSFEWENPRLGKIVKEVNLRSVKRSDGGNAIMLLAVSVTGDTPRN